MPREGVGVQSRVGQTGKGRTAHAQSSPSLSKRCVHYVIDVHASLAYETVMPTLHTVAETAGFLADAEAEGMTAASRAGLIDRLAANPETGDLIVGSGGIRKLRVAGRSKGRSGGYRVLTAYVGPDAPVYLLAVLNKGDRETFEPDEIKVFAKLTASIKAHWQRRRSR